MNYKITTLVENCVYGRKLQAEHGLSLYIETPENRLLFDTGASDLFIRNARLLNIDLQKVDYLVLSHGHSDHTGGLRHFLELNAEATVVCKREVFFPKFKDERENGMKYTRSLDLSRFRFIDELTELVPGVFLFPSVDIIDPKDTHFERFWIQKEDGSRVPDTIVKRKQKKRDSSKKKRMAPQNHPLKLVYLVFPILIRTLNGVNFRGNTEVYVLIHGRVAF